MSVPGFTKKRDKKIAPTVLSFITVTDSSMNTDHLLFLFSVSVCIPVEALSVLRMKYLSLLLLLGSMLHIMSLTSPHNPPIDYVIKGNALQKNTSSRNLRLGMQQCALFWPQPFL